VRRLARTILSRRGFRVLEARSAGDALVICEHHDGPVDLVLTDIVMPLMSGELLVERVRAMRPGIRAVFMSGYPDKGVVRRGVLAPELFVQKPFTPDSLLHRICEVLADGRAPALR
jgi:CheY-like chemotaxis protein